MLDALARLAHNRRRWVVLASVAFFLVAGTVGGSAFDVLKPFGFDDPDSESSVLDARTEEASGLAPGARVIALVEPGPAIETAGGRAAVRKVQRRLDRDPAIARSVSLLDSRDPAFVSTDGEASYVLGFTAGGVEDSDREERMVERLEAAYADDETVTLGGAAVAGSQIGHKVESDLQRAELIALPFILLLSFLVFRSAVAALLPPMVGILAIVGTLLGLRLLAEVTEVSIFAVNLVTGLGLGLAIDYSLFIVSRYRDEIARRGPGLEALRTTLATAGRTVLFSALTVSAALAALMVFPQRFLYSMGLGGAMVALLAATISLTLLPAVLAMLGSRVNAGAPARLRRAAEADARGEQGRWYRFSRWVMKRPGRIALATAALMVAMGLPFLESRFVFADASILPADLSAKQVDQAFEERFDERLITTVNVQFEADAGKRTNAALAPVAKRIAAIEGVRQVSKPSERAPGLTELTVVQEAEPFSARGEEVVREIRALDSELPFLVGGDSAELVDMKSSLGDHLLLALGLIAAATFVLLFLMTGSVVLPVKALIMNLLTVSAAFGILVLIFQEGNLEWLLGFTSQGALDTSQPILLFALIFGLSTDYAVFLLTRIKEARDSGLPTEEAVPVGLERTGRIVTFAALLFAIAIGAFVTSDIVFIKEAGLGTAIGVLIDATIVRALLVPSLMRLLGEWNWWAPGPLRRLHDRIGLSEGAPRPTPAEPGAPAPAETS
jgi:uncharacterized membrane protein YdfJ with MMPL/SSD domain